MEQRGQGDRNLLLGLRGGGLGVLLSCIFTKHLLFIWSGLVCEYIMSLALGYWTSCIEILCVSGEEQMFPSGVECAIGLWPRSAVSPWLMQNTRTGIYFDVCVMYYIGALFVSYMPMEPI